MEVKIVYDEETFNTGVVYVGGVKYAYNYDVDFKELLSNILEELDIDYEAVAFDFDE